MIISEYNMWHVLPMSSDIFSMPNAMNVQVNPLHTETFLSCCSRTIYTLIILFCLCRMMFYEITTYKL